MDFKIDENLPAEASRIFRDAGHDAVSVLDQRLGGKPDSDIATVCKAESRVLITLDTDFANIRAYPPVKSPGIIVIRTNNQSKAVILSFIRQIAVLLESENPKHHLWIVEPHRVRIHGPA